MALADNLVLLGYDGYDYVGAASATVFGSPTEIASDISRDAWQGSAGTPSYHQYGSTEYLSGNAEWTVSTYLKVPATDDVRVGRWETDSGWQSWVIIVSVANGIRFYTPDSGYASVGGGSVSAGEWVRVTVTMASDQTVTVYKNGTSVGSGSLADPVAIARGINTPTDAEDAFAGAYVDLAIWTRKLSGAEITSLNGDGLLSQLLTPAALNSWDPRRLRPPGRRSPATQRRQPIGDMTTATTIAGTAAVIEAPDSSSATGSQTITGTSSVTEASDTTSSSGALTITGTAAVTEQADSPSAAGTQTISASGAVTEAADASSATGAVTITGSAAITEQPDSSSSGTSIAGSAAITEQADTSAGSGAITIAGTAAITEASDSCSATGTVTISGSAAITEQPDSRAASGALTITGSAAVTEQPDSVFGNGGGGINGTAAITEQADASSGSGSLAISGTAATTEAADSRSSAGALTISGSGLVTEAADTLDADAEQVIAGFAAILEEADICAALESIVAVPGTVTLTVDAPDVTLVAAAAGVSLSHAAPSLALTVSED